MLGEFVWPDTGEHWSSLLLNALAELDVEPDAARKAVQRSAESGLIATTRQGRQSAWNLTPRALQIMNAGYERTYGWHTRDTTWDGRWLQLTVTIPDSQRKLRHHLQTRLTWAGLGSPSAGQWLTTHWERGDDVAGIVRGLGLAEQAHTIVGHIGPLGDQHELVAAAWDLKGLRDDYLEFIDQFSLVRPRTDRDCFRARIALVQDWRRFPYVDPDLPREFLPADWPGVEASRLFHDRHQAWRARSRRHWDRLEAAG
jgi:phenylacetic acid degradation operon negative regulatory protein